MTKIQQFDDGIHDEAQSACCLVMANQACGDNPCGHSYQGVLPLCVRCKTQPFDQWHSEVGLNATNLERPVPRQTLKSMANDINRKSRQVEGLHLPGTRSTASAEAARDGKRGAPCNTSSPSLVKRHGLATRSCSSLSTPTTSTALRVDFLAFLYVLQLRPLFWRSRRQAQAVLRYSVTPFLIPFIVSCPTCTCSSVCWPGDGVYVCRRSCS